MRRPGQARVAGAILMAAGTAAAPGRPYGCWSIDDDLQRLTCFDMAFGPPAAAVPAPDPDPDGPRGGGAAGGPGREAPRPAR